MKNQADVTIDNNKDGGNAIESLMVAEENPSNSQTPTDNNDTASTTLPISCYPDSQRPGMFRVTRHRGKTLQSGGFGVTVVIQVDKEGNELPENWEDIANEENGNRGQAITAEEDVENDDADDENESKSEVPENVSSNSEGENADKPNLDTEELKEGKCSKTKKPKPKAFVYLFLEEVLFLSEQGLLECCPEIPADNNQKDGTDKQDIRYTSSVLSSSQLYALLEPMQLPMASYLTYAHLRRQTFRVMRYSPQRLTLLQDIQDLDFESANDKQQHRDMKLKLRRNVQQAPPPAILDEHDDDDHRRPQFAFCVYPPDSQFSRADPGLPSFLVVVTYFGQSTLSFSTLLKLFQQADGIPVKIATVADSGTVMMFGISDYGVPILDPNTKRRTKI